MYAVAISSWSSHGMFCVRFIAAGMRSLLQDQWSRGQRSCWIPFRDNAYHSIPDVVLSPRLLASRISARILEYR